MLGLVGLGTESLKVSSPSSKLTGSLATEQSSHTDLWRRTVMPNGCVISGDDTGFVRLWNPADGKVQSRALHKEYVTDLAVLTDGHSVVTGGADHAVWLWDTVTGEQRKIITHIDGEIRLMVLRDGRVVSWSTGHDDSENGGSVCLWDPVTNEQRQIITFDAEVSCVVQLPDGRIYSASEDTTHGRWNPVTEEGDLLDAETDGHAILRITVLNDGRLVMERDDHVLLIYEKDMDVLIASYPIGSAVSCLACSRDSSRIYVGLENGELLFLQLESPTAMLNEQSRVD